MKVETKKAIIGKLDTCTVTVLQDGGIFIGSVTLVPEETIEFCSLLNKTMDELQAQVRKEREQANECK